MYKINKKVIKLVNKLGLELRIGVSPEAVGIYLSEPIDLNSIWCFYIHDNEGHYIFLQSGRKFAKGAIEFFILHELAHSILHMLQFKIDEQLEEVIVNNMALALMVQMEIKPPAEVLDVIQWQIDDFKL